MEIIDFKSHPDYFYDEKDGKKNNTIRAIDVNDKRFQTLLNAWKQGKYPLIRINHSECCQEHDKATEVHPTTMYSFLRNIQHIAIWNGFMTITWKHVDVEEKKK